VSERIIHPLTPQEESRLDRLAALAERDRDDIIERGRLQEEAAAQPTFVGEVLRAMLEDSPVSVFELAELANVDFVTFDDFRCGRRELPAIAFERVARRLGFSLVRTCDAVGA
jgi:hypothetical protein